MSNSADLGSDEPARSTRHAPICPPPPANSLLPAPGTHSNSSADSADLRFGGGGGPNSDHSVPIVHEALKYQPEPRLQRLRLQRLQRLRLQRLRLQRLQRRMQTLPLPLPLPLLLSLKRQLPLSLRLQLRQLRRRRRRKQLQQLRQLRLQWLQQLRRRPQRTAGMGGSSVSFLPPSSSDCRVSLGGPTPFILSGPTPFILGGPTPFILGGPTPFILGGPMRQYEKQIAAAAAIGMGGSYGGPSPSDLSCSSTISSEHKPPLGGPMRQHEQQIAASAAIWMGGSYGGPSPSDLSCSSTISSEHKPPLGGPTPIPAEFLSVVDSHEDPQNFNRQGIVNDSNSFNFMASHSSNPALLEEDYEKLPEQLKGLIMYVSLFPSIYEFRKDELVQMWMAEGFIEESQRERMEDIGCAYFNSLHEKGFLVSSRCDSRVDFDSVSSVPTYNPRNLLYKVNTVELPVLVNTTTAVDYLAGMDGNLDGALEIKHLSLNCKDIDEMTFGILKRCEHLRTLLLLSGCGSSMKYVPRDLFLSLKDLRTLNLSRTLISELPSSIRNAISLRYLNLSNTPIKRLPESIDSLHHLQTIKLRGCVNFLQLPKGMKKLINLRHIDLDIIRQLWSMPPYLGNLTNLQTLSAFLIGREEGYHIGELKNLNDLRGVLRISRLENVSNKEEAEGAALIDKKCLQRLELRWSNVFTEKLEEQEKILECLQPHASLKELQIQHYAGSTLPTWISNPSLAELVVLTLYRCTNCQLLPCIGQLQMLKSLSIIEMNEVKEINHQCFRDGPVDQAFHAFPKLKILEVDIMFNLKEWKEVKLGDLPSLLKLTMDSCPELGSLPSLSWLKSLKHLEFRRCPKLLSLPSDGLPTSLESFIVIDCPELKEWCRKVEGEDRCKIYHVPSIWFDCEEVSQKEV